MRCHLATIQQQAIQDGTLHATKASEALRGAFLGEELLGQCFDQGILAQLASLGGRGGYAVELGDEVALRELEASTRLSQHIVARLSPRLVVVPDEAVEELLREFTAKGYTPKEVR